MQPEISTPSTDWREGGLLNLIPKAWVQALGLLLLCSIALGLMAAREWGEMFHQWWEIDTYTHILLVPFIIAWLVWMKLEELAKAAPQIWLPGFAIAGLGVGLWLFGRASGINIIAHAGAVGALQGAVIAVLGPRVSLLLALPLCFASFLVPIGDEFIPQLQSITADIAVALTLWSGIPATIDGIYIDTPVGLFIVAEACSGVKFLVAMVTLAVLVAFTRFNSWLRRAAFLLIAIIVPIITNGIRAWGTIYIAQFKGVEFAAGFDHIFYGWIFFAIVVAIVLGAAWRFFEREPEEYGWDNGELSQFGWLKRLEHTPIAGVVGVACLLALAISGGLLAAIVAPSAIG